ncbi:15-hydroxyprostaglandin dehydrogenase [NAD(+)]-like [Heptranchias perlo]|uniref:15-hydroxyprostaglandin dehydrogenase [NAD(+)]-like n=1 Tax=Heptranchias perlo TaxID=212740 RepID=UPI00355A7FF6
MELGGKVALVTGAAQGIGKVVTETLLANGAKVSLLDANIAGGEATKTAFEQVYGAENILFLPCDVTSESQLKDSFSKTLDKFKRLDIVCNNAGIFEEGNWEKCISVNLISVIKGTYLGLQHMSKENGGSGGVIVNVASMAGLLPFVAGPVYAASKHAVLGFTKSLAMSCLEKHGVRINAVCPTFVDTLLLENLQSDENLAQFAFLKEKVNSLIADFGVVKPSQVAAGFLQVVMDQTRNGAMLKILRDGKNEYEIPAEIQKSQ